MKTCVFTIVSNNYLHYANTLFESVKTHAPDVDLCLGLCDRKTDKTYCPGADVVELTELPIEGLGRFIYQYSILELNTAMKPYLIEYLMDKGYDKVIYIDPDIKIFNSLDGMLSLLDEYNVLLTPHLTNLLDDGLLPNELGILQAGSYNLGYIGLQTNSETRKLVNWWQRKLYKECVVDISRGLFVDQKWMDMVPSMFKGVYINRDEGWNVAYWNLNHRDIKVLPDDGFEINGRPLLFFHYSGYTIGAKSLSKHQNRLSKSSKGKGLVKLCEIYDECLVENGIDDFKALSYHYAKFADGVLVPDAARKLIKDDEFYSTVNFFSLDDASKIHDFLNSRALKASRSSVLVTRLMEMIWKSRVDLQDAFPDLYGVDALRFSEWLLSAGVSECGLDSVYTDPVLSSLERARSSASGCEDGASSVFYSMAWKCRHLVPLSLKKKLGLGVKSFVLSRAYPRKSMPVDSGINLIGYMQAESGVGEAARSSLRALKSSSLPFSVMDYRTGNISRMDEVVSVDYAIESTHNINLVHVNADQSRVVRESLGQSVFNGKYNVGYWYWEMPEFPEDFSFAFEQVDEVWVSTVYNQVSISQKTDKPVRVVPPNVSVAIDESVGRKEFDLKDDEFVFLHMSDALSIPERKNPLGVVKAFEQAFSDYPESKVKLILKISNLDKLESMKAQLEVIAARDPRVVLLDGYLERPTLNNLLNNVDCYVSLHRAEGFGLPMAEAMSLGKVVVATHWSGNVDFMDETNCLPVRYELVDLKADVGPYKKGQHWAEPCIADAADKMFNISNDPLLYQRLSSAARETIASKFSPENSSRVIEARVEEICNFI